MVLRQLAGGHRGDLQQLAVLAYDAKGRQGVEHRVEKFEGLAGETAHQFPALDRSDLRKQTVEPVFGIIKHAMGFRRFMLRGLEKVSLEWTLVTTSYNLRRLFNLGMRMPKA